MARREVVVGFFSFTVVEPEHESAYDAWHRLDHLPEQYRIEGIVRGDRWVGVDPPGDGLAAAQHLTLYLMTDPVDEVLRDFRRLAAQLRDAGRFFEQRRSLLFGAWSVGEKAVAAHVPVAPEVLPWRPARGVHVVVDEPGAPDRTASLLASGGVAGAWTFSTSPDLHHDSWQQVPSRITVAWLDAPAPVVPAPMLPSAPAALLARTFTTQGVQR